MEIKIRVSDAVNEQDICTQKKIYLPDKYENLLFYHQKNLTIPLYPFFPLYNDKIAENYLKDIINKSDLLLKIKKISNFDFLKGTYLIASNVYSNNYSHYTIQIFSSLLLAKDYNLFSKKIKVIFPKLTNFQKQLLNLFIEAYGEISYIEMPEVSHKAIIIEHAIFTNTLFSFIPNYSLLKSFRLFKEKIINKNKKSKNLKIYISRKDSKIRIAVNEDEVIHFFKKNNFSILELSKYSVRDQISLFHYAKVIAGAHGAGGINLLYSNNGVYFIEYFSEARISNCHAKIAKEKECFYSGTINKAINKNLGQDFSYLVDIDLLEKIIDAPDYHFINLKHTDNSIYSIGFTKKHPNNIISLDISKEDIRDKESLTLKYKKITYNFECLIEDKLKLVYLSKDNYIDGNIDKSIEYIQKAFIANLLTPQNKIFFVTLLIKKYNFKLAISILNELLNLELQWGDPYFYLSLIHEAKKEIAKAIACAHKAIEVEPYNLQRKAHLANLLRKKGDFDAAIEVMNAAMELNPYWSEPHFQFSAIHDAKGELDEAIACARKATEVEPYHLQRKAQLCNLLRKKGDFDATIEVMNAAIELNPYWSEPHFQFSAIHDAKGELDEAIVCAEKATEIEPYHLQRKAQLCNLLRKKGDFDATIEVMNAAMELNPYWSEPHFQFSAIHDAKGELDEAIACAKKATEVEPYHLQRKAHLANLLRKKGDFDSAIEVMNAAMELNPYWSEPYFQFSAIHEAKSELDEAIACARKATEVEPYNLQRKAQLCNLLRKKGDFDTVIEIMNAAIELNPYWSEPHFQFSAIHDAKGELDKAIACARKATEVEPYHLQRKAHLANLLRKKGDFDAAIEIMNAAMELNPYWSEPHFQFSSIHDAKGELDEAIVCAKKATEVEPYHLQRKAHLANLLRKKDDFDAAIEVMNAAMELNPYWSEPHFQFSAIHDAKGELDEAIACARKAAEVEPYNFQRKAHLTNLLRKKGDFDAAIEVMNTAMESNPYWSEPYVQFSLIHNAKGELDEAIACAKKATEVEPYNLSRKAHLSVLLRKGKQYEEAMFSIKEGLRLLPGWSDGYIHLSHTHMEKGQLTLAIETAQKAIAMHPQPPAHWKKHLDGLLAKMNAMVPSSSSPVVERINAYGKHFNAKTYLEIGVCKGATFNSVDISHKTGVDPSFQFDIEQYRSSTTFFYPITSDIFFEQFKNDSKKFSSRSGKSTFYFDLIFIDGLHTFEQTLRDFENSFLYSHEKTIWIFDNTCPSHCFSAINSLQKVQKWRAIAGLSKDKSWHGDVFKVIFAIHEKYPEFSYCTQINKGNPQTILWKTEAPTHRKKVFQSYEQINHMRYEDFVENAWVLYPVNDEEVIEKIYSNIDPAQYKTGEEYKKIIRRIVTDQERAYAAENKELKERIAKLEKALYSKNEKKDEVLICSGAEQK